MRVIRLLIAAFLGVVVCASVSCSSRTPGEPLSGIWEGKLEYPGLELRVAFRIVSSHDGDLTAVMLRPDQDDREIRVAEVASEAGQVRLVVEAVGGVFSGQMSSDRASIEGRWDQRGRSDSLVLHRVSEISKPPRAQTPQPPYPYDVEDVAYESLEDGVTVAGTLTVPPDGRPCAAAVLISGGGAHDRDYVVLAHRRFMVLADYLTRNGIAVLRFDDRGVGDSTGDRSTATSLDYCLDALGGVRFLRGHSEVDSARVGIIGHSEGGTIASLAAARSSDVAFVVMMGSPGLPGRQYNLQFEESVGRALGESERSIEAKRDLQERILGVIAEETDVAVARIKLQRILGELDPPMPDARVDAALRRFLSPWFRFNVLHNPGDTLKEVSCPVLAVIGEKDVHVPPQENLEAIGRALLDGGNEDFRTLELSSLNHFLQKAETGSPEEYGRIEETLSRDAMDLITTWILARVDN